jgi:hypothetical protein
MSLTKKNHLPQNTEPEAFLIKEILKLVEASSSNRRDIGGLTSLCFKGPQAQFFPPDQRQALRTKWGNIRRKTIDQYLKYLSEFGISPGSATLLELSQSSRGDNQDINDIDDISTDLSQAFADISICKTPSPEQRVPSLLGAKEQLTPGTARQLLSPSLRHFTPLHQSGSFFSSPNSFNPLQSASFTTYNSHYMNSPPPCPLSSQKIDFSDHQQHSIGGKLSSVSSSAGFSGLSDSVVGLEGTKNAPFKFRVNPFFPEKNPARIKFVRVPNYAHNGFEHVVWEASITVPHHDFSKWDAFFGYPNFIMFKGPSMSHWEAGDLLWNPKCHDVKDLKAHPFPLDVATKTAHTAIELAIEKAGELRDENWWQAEVVEAGQQEQGDQSRMVLDNNILSPGASHQIAKVIRKLKAVDGTDLRGCVLVWKICEAGGIQTEKTKERIPDLKSLLEL